MKKPAPKPKSKSLSKSPEPGALAKRAEPSDDLIKVEANKKLGPAATLANRAKAMVVNIESGLINANTLLGELKASRTALEEQRTFFTRPLREHVKRIEELFRPTIKRLEEADDELRGKVVTFIDAKRIEGERAAAELTAKANAAAAKGQESKATALAVKSVETIEAATTRVMTTDAGSTSTRQVDDFEIEYLGSVPKEYLTLDEKAVRAAMRSGVTTITGLRIFKRTTLAVSAGGGAGASA